MSDMYTDVERSLYMTLAEALVAPGHSVAEEGGEVTTIYPIFNNIVTKKDYPNHPAALCIMKISDVPNYQNGGGTQAVIKEVAARDDFGNPAAWTETPWPQFYDLLYQLIVIADTLEDARILETCIRRTLSPRKPLRLYDSENKVWTDKVLNTSYGGYINRDVPEDFIYWRVTNIRVEALDYVPESSVLVPAMTQVTVNLAPIDVVDGNVDVDMREIP